MSDVVIEPATFEDLDELSGLLGELFSEESDFLSGQGETTARAALDFRTTESRTRFCSARDRTIVGMINLLFTISTAEGGFVMVLEDLVVHKDFQGKGYGSKLLRIRDRVREAEKFPADHAC